MALGTGNITLAQVKTEIEGNSTATVTSLNVARLVAIEGGWNSTYEGSRNRLSNFKGYTQVTRSLTYSAFPTSFSNSGGDCVITITSNCQWTASYGLIAGSPPYPTVSLTATSGTGNGSTTFTMGTNTSGELQWRVTLVTAYPYQASAVTRTVDIIQLGSGGLG